jgi:O-acetylhomoserine/O-acetylserine sulfhydrylase-like pyridoxal-dependent enzyme
MGVIKLSEKDRKFHFDTNSVIGGYELDKTVKYNALAVPLFQTVAYPYHNSKEAEEVFDPYSGVNGFIYARRNNPTVDIFEKRIAKLESGEWALATSSGMSAIALLGFHLARGGEVVLSNRVYACTFELYTRYLSEMNIKTKIIMDPSDFTAWEDAINKNTRFIYIETPSNPGLFIANIEKLAQIAHEHNIPLVVDNTLATPALQRPLEQGADIVIESASKYISGNATVLGGAIIGEKEMLEKMRRQEYIQFGSALSPFNAWLMLLGLESLSLRMEKHSNNAIKVARFLEGHKNIVKVNYPGLESHPQHELAAKQMSNFGSLMSFETAGNSEDAYAFLDALKFIPNVTHEGSARTIACHPWSTNFGRLTKEEKIEAGISDTLIRLSVGIENPDDIINDLDQALDKLNK